MIKSPMKLSRNTGLVLEGGGMRCAFTCGVLDAMMKHFIRQGSIFDPQLLYDRFPNERCHSTTTPSSQVA